jgi:hypothetical protein
MRSTPILTFPRQGGRNGEADAAKIRSFQRFSLKSQIRQMTLSSINPGSGDSLAAHLIKQSEQDAAVTPMDAVLDAARAGKFTDDQCFRLLGRLWTLKRIL